METKEKNKRLMIIVGVMLLVVGVSLAYFVSSVLINGNGARTKITTAKIKGATINVEGVISFEDLSIYPGHKTISSIKLTATGNNELIPYNLIWRGTNSLTTPLNYVIYKTSEEINVTSTCDVKRKAVGSVTQISEECSISNIDKLGSEIARGTINKNDSKVELAKEEFINATPSSLTMYYYVILEYPNLNEEQNYDLEGSLEGEVTVESSNIEPDINILAINIEQEDGTYKEVEDMPQSGYAINLKKSTCSNGAKVRWDYDNNELITSNLTKSGTSCYLYFDKAGEKEVNTILGTLTAKTYDPNFGSVAYTDEGIYAVSDGMYGGESYYWRGAATTNYLQFGGYCWRIVRINGDGTIRLIYDGATCHQNGTSTTDNILTSLGGYNGRERSEYVGWTYVEGKQRPEAGDTAIDSNAKTQTENWYNTNLASYSDKIADGKFCNDRNVASDYSWSSQTTSTFYYAAYKRFNEPTFDCTNNNDIYILKVGAITMDEIIYAGGSNEYNNMYYLYNGYYYWSMTPGIWDGGWAGVYGVRDLGNVANGHVNVGSMRGFRPVINLRSDVTISSGNGTLDKPYVVAD